MMQDKVQEIATQILGKKKKERDANSCPLVFMDTSAVIDFEHLVRMWKRKYPNASREFYHGLRAEFPVYLGEFMKQAAQEMQTGRGRGALYPIGKRII